jgi:hypothetical protein
MKNTRKQNQASNSRIGGFSNSITLSSGRARQAKTSNIINIKQNTVKLNTSVPSNFSVPSNLTGFSSVAGGSKRSTANFKKANINNSNSNMSTSQRKLRAHNVLIEQDEEFDDYYIVNHAKNSQTNIIDTKTVKNNNLEIKLLSSSIGDYESSKLQVEIENMKKMRHNYGTDWLLSTPSLLDFNKQILNDKMANISNNKDQERQRLISSNNDDSKTNSKSRYDERMEHKRLINQNLLKETTNMNEIKIMESFAVYRSFTFNSTFSNNNNNTKGDNFDLEFDLRSRSSANDKEDTNDYNSVCLCIISLTENYMIEKDETNAEILSIDEYADLESIELFFTTSKQYGFILDIFQFRV